MVTVAHFSCQHTASCFFLGGLSGRTPFICGLSLSLLCIIAFCFRKFKWWHSLLLNQLDGDVSQGYQTEVKALPGLCIAKYILIPFFSHNFFYGYIVNNWFSDDGNSLTVVQELKDLTVKHHHPSWRISKAFVQVLELCVLTCLNRLCCWLQVQTEAVNTMDIFWMISLKSLFLLLAMTLLVACQEAWTCCWACRVRIRYVYDTDTPQTCQKLCRTYQATCQIK